MRKIEVLSPAGNIDAFYAAIAAGANAIYLSGKSFGARAFASNFTIDELKIIIPYAHLRKVKVYVTINTIVKDTEYDELDKFLNELNLLKVDAVIIQDIGVLVYIKENYPTLTVHASTQMNANNVNMLKTLYTLGVDRVILAREYPLDSLIKDINDNPYLKELEYEVFCHGAMCYSESGKCLFSFSHGGRSGNRGECAGSCRKNYSILEDGNIIINNEPILSMKDMYTIDHIKDLYDSDIISSIKIEGRMKSPSYVYLTTYLYKKAVESAYKGKVYNPTKAELDNLNIIFNRTYTKGYLFNDDNTNLTTNGFVNHQGILIGKIDKKEKNGFYIKTLHSLKLHDALRINDQGIFITRMLKNNNVISSCNEYDYIFIETNKDIKVNDEVRLTSSEALDKEIELKIHDTKIFTSVSMILKAYVGRSLSLTLSIDNSKQSVTVTSDILDYTDNMLSNDRIIEQLSKLGDTPYKLNNTLILTDNNSFIKVSMLNDLRRKAVEKLNELVLLSYDATPKRNILLNKDINVIKHESSITCIVNNTDQYNTCINKGINNLIYLKDIKRNNNNSLIKNDIATPSEGILSWYNNIISSKSIISSFRLGYNEVILSPECILDSLDIKDLSNFNIGYLVYGKYDLMISNHCPIAKAKNIPNKNCNSCLKHSYTMLDEKNNSYPICFERDSCLFKILSDKAVNNLSNLNYSFINSYYFIFTDETNNEINKILDSFIKNNKTV